MQAIIDALKQIGQVVELVFAIALFASPKLFQLIGTWQEQIRSLKQGQVVLQENHDKLAATYDETRRWTAENYATLQTVKDAAQTAITQTVDLAKLVPPPSSPVATSSPVIVASGPLIQAEGNTLPEIANAISQALNPSDQKISSNSQGEPPFEAEDGNNEVEEEGIPA